MNKLLCLYLEIRRVFFFADLLEGKGEKKVSHVKEGGVSWSILDCIFTASENDKWQSTVLYMAIIRKIIEKKLFGREIKKNDKIIYLGLEPRILVGSGGE